jgi:hypothetical protein
MRKSVCMTVMAVLLAAVPVMAEESGNPLVQQILQAARLPTVTREARVLGVPEQDLQAVFATAREHRILAGDLTALLSEENDAVRKYGPVDNFGAFVQEKLAAGLRGRELAAAIHAEHAARGIGKGRAGKVGKPGKAPGPPGAADTPGKAVEQVGKPDHPGEHGGKPDNPGEHVGKPASPGKSGETGKKGGTR